MDRSKRLVLASASPRRRQLLEAAGIDFVIVKSDYEENNGQDLSPDELVLKHAIGKAKGAQEQVDEGIILGADTIVVLDGKIIGKPEDDADAKRILKALSGKRHQVYTGFALLDAKTKKIVKQVVITDVVFKDITDAQIDDYLNFGEHIDKAGAYAFQGKARIFIDRIAGSETNIIGLPMDELKEALDEISK